MLQHAASNRLVMSTSTGDRVWQSFASEVDGEKPLSEHAQPDAGLPASATCLRFSHAARPPALVADANAFTE